ncbi:MAG: TonB-dependent receptor, partial [Flavobacteriaceae bacterium]
MNRTPNNYLLLLCFFLFVQGLANAQTENQEQPLAEILKIVEQRFNVTFTYADANVKDVSIAPPSFALNLEDTLQYLEGTTQLNFGKLNNNNIVIRKVSEVKNEVKNKPFRLQVLDEVVITNFLTKGIAKPNDGTTTINPQDFGILPGLIEPDVLQTIQALPGVQSADETVSNLNIRGGSHDENLILWDGIKMYQSGHFFGLISAFNPYLTKDVVVIKNGTSAFYGDGVSSVIDMRSKNDIENEFTGGAGSNLISADAYATIPISRNTELQVSGRRSITDAITTPTYDQYFKRISQDTDLSNSQQSTTLSTDANFYFFDASLKFLYDISDDDQLRLNFLTIYNNLDYQERSTTNTVDEALNSGLTQFNLAGSATYRHEWNDDFSSSIEFYVSQHDLKATNFDIINDQRLIQENEVIDGGLKVSTNYQFTDEIQWSNGYQFFEVGISNLEDVNNPLFRSYIKEVVRTHAGFSEAKYSSRSGNTNATLGVRANYYDKFEKFLIEPRLSLSQNILNNLKVELLGEFKSQVTTQIIDRQNDFLGIEKRRWVLANDMTIPVVESKQASLGLHYYKNGLRMVAEGYFKEVDGITSRTQGFQNQFQFVNAIGSYQVTGLDLLLNQQIGDLSAWLSYS